jgi:hypothetical protein
MYIQTDIFGEHQPVDKHGNPLKIGDTVDRSTLCFKAKTGTVVGYQLSVVIDYNNKLFAIQPNLLEKIDND